MSSNSANALKTRASQGRGGDKRIEFIDLVKGICIILVVAVHYTPHSFLTPIEWMIMMPPFFVLSGLFFKEYGGYVQMLIKKVNTIIIPFIFFHFGAYLVHEGRLLLLHIDVPGDVRPLADFINFSYGAIWFLPTLFWQHLIFGAIVKASKKWMVQAMLVAVVACVGWAFRRYGIFPPFLIAQGMSNLLLFYFGYLLKKTPILYQNKYDRYNIAISVALIGFTLAIYYLCGYHEISFTHETTNLWFVEICGCASLAVAVLLLCKIIKRIPIVSYLGRYSIVVLCIHIHVASRVQPILDKVGISFPLSTTLITLLICLCLIPLFVRFLPWFVAQKDLIPMPRGKHSKPENVN